ncbi:MAG: ferrous iron transport protein A [Oscillospiraceae bacterium]|nr:ferrous iron transport protein A [Lachnospiraceae bacterium]MBQ2627768.1 ferrous iron transport protein A [Eubacterium sp.]MBQ6362469.1 ferrous iron transport protein A [Lachnospiraceae bacterium]MBR0161566.1 ferrous iron transport protein A [Oscillospiraceae bacterium]MBR2995133.1 ferrous iron transport protein A [Lachnospiraceae bacterium]
MPVTMINAGKSVIIQRIAGTDDVRQHLAELGFVVGEKITVVSNNHGNVILQVKDARIALDAKMANRVIVA